MTIFTCSCGHVVKNPNFKRSRIEGEIKTALICENTSCPNPHIKYLTEQEKVIFGVR